MTEPQRAKYLGRVFQDPMRGTAADMQIVENLALAKRRGLHRGLAWGVTKEEKAEFPALLKKLDLGLDTRMEAKVGLLSGGQRQALTLLMATLTQPKLLLLDEHTAAPVSYTHLDVYKRQAHEAPRAWPLPRFSRSRPWNR